MTQQYTDAEVALMYANIAIDSARTKAIITENKDNPEKLLSLVFNDKMHRDILVKQIKITSIVTDVYKIIDLENKLLTQLDSTVLRGYACFISEEYNNPWCKEYDNFFQKWVTISDVVKDTLAFEGMDIDYLFGCIDGVDRLWLQNHIDTTPYKNYVALEANRKAYLTRKRQVRKQIAGYCNPQGN